MEISQLRYFLALCEQQSFTRAAEQCGISQPSLSNAIMALETELGGPLVRRSPFELTALGKAVRPQFRSALRHITGASKIAAIHRRGQEVEHPGIEVGESSTRSGDPFYFCDLSHRHNGDVRQKNDAVGKFEQLARFEDLVGDACPPSSLTLPNVR